jgi:putative acetyltransferase
MIVRAGDFANRKVLSLLQEHLGGMHANSPPGSVYALDLTGLQSRAVSLFCVWERDDLMAIGALKEINFQTGEVKSMRTAQSYLRRGAGGVLLNHMITVARSRGYRRLSLETGSGPAFEPALALYRRYGFKAGDQFGDYASSAFNQFLHLEL